ncbi:hypothetical protein L1887_13951 [Cichorium endivia]|nr:hypothetical protein L1887_13951 [Cichorium endivia]
MPDVTDSSSKSQIDQSDPLYLHPSDHPGLILVSTPFDGNRFGAWKRYVSIALSARNKLSFIEGTDKPQPTDPRYGAWRRCNDMIISWMLNSLSRDIAESVLYSETAHEIWTELDDRYGQANGAKLYQLQKNLREIVQGNSNIATYFTRMKKYWDELNTISLIPTCTCGAAKILAQFENDQRLIQFLMGLNDDYGNIRGSILMMKPLPSINQAYTILIQDEKQREESASMYASNLSSPFFPQTNNSQSFSYLRGKSEGNIVCNHCKKPGHTTNKCYKLVGFPNDFKYTKGRKMAGNVEVITSTGTNPRSQQLPAANFAGKMAGICYTITYVE